MPCIRSHRWSDWSTNARHWVKRPSFLPSRSNVLTRFVRYQAPTSRLYVTAPTIPNFHVAAMLLTSAELIKTRSRPSQRLPGSVHPSLGETLSSACHTAKSYSSPRYCKMPKKSTFVSGCGTVIVLHHEALRSSPYVYTMHILCSF